MLLSGCASLSVPRVLDDGRDDLPLERLGGGDPLHMGMAVEQPLNRTRGTVFGEVLRSQPAHRRDERNRLRVSSSAKRSALRRSSVTAWAAGTIPTETAPAASSRSGRPAGSAKLSRPSHPAEASSARAARKNPAITSALSNTIPFQMSPCTWCANSWASTISISSSE